MSQDANKWYSFNMEKNQAEWDMLEAQCERGCLRQQAALRRYKK